MANCRILQREAEKNKNSWNFWNSYYDCNTHFVIITVSVSSERINSFIFTFWSYHLITVNILVIRGKQSIIRLNWKWKHVHEISKLLRKTFWSYQAWFHAALYVFASCTVSSPYDYYSCSSHQSLVYYFAGGDEDLNSFGMKSSIDCAERMQGWTNVGDDTGLNTVAQKQVWKIENI